MNDVKQWLKAGDPVSGESGLSPVDAAKMRRVIVAAVGSDVREIAGLWPGPFVMAAVVAASLVIGVGIGLRLDPGPGRPIPKPGEQAAARGERRQLQFVAAGGTRIIWTFSDQFGL
jgi:hypothetical protein